MTIDNQLKNNLKIPRIHSRHEDDMEKAEMSVLTSLLKENQSSSDRNYEIYLSENTGRITRCACPFLFPN